MPNLKAKIDQNNQKIFENPLQKQKYVTFENCPMRGVSLTENVMCYGKTSCDNEKYKRKLFKGICEITIKKRYANYKSSFNAEKNKNVTKLTTQYWKLGNKKLHPWISWSNKG